MKKFLLLTCLLFATLQNFAECGVQPSFTYTLDGNTATFTNTSTVSAGYSITSFYWEFESNIYDYDPYPTHTFEGICENGNAGLHLDVEYLGSYCGTIDFWNVVVLITNPIQIILNDEIDSVLQTIVISPEISGGTAPYTYYWYNEGEIYNEAEFSFPNLEDYYFLNVGCFVTDSNGCELANHYYGYNPFFECTLELDVVVEENLVTAQTVFSADYILGGEWGGNFQILGSDTSEFYYGGDTVEYLTHIETIGNYDICFYIDIFNFDTLAQCPTQICESFVINSIDQDCNASISYSIINENDVYFTNLSSGYFNQVLWDFGDGETSFLADPSHSFDAGTHTVILNISNTETLCQSTDTVSFYINEPAHICGFVFMDDNANGIFDSEESLADSITLYTFNNEFITSNENGFDAYIQSGIVCLYALINDSQFEITTPALDEYCEGGILINLAPGEELCPLPIGISIPKTTICGTMYFDANNNGFYDNGEAPLAYENIFTIISPSEIATIVTDNVGGYCLEVPLGSQVYLNPDFSLNEFADIQPSEFSNYIYDLDPITFNFGVYYVDNELDLAVDLSATGSCVPGFESYYNIYAHNYSNLSSTATITMHYNDLQSYSYSNPLGINDDALHTVTWDVTIEPFSEQSFTVGMLNSTDMILDDVITWVANIEAIGVDPDVVTLNNNSSVSQTVVGSYDPNNKLVSPEGYGPNGEFPFGSVGDLLGFEELIYTINFQNTGTAPAVNVVVTDEIDTDLDVTTLHLIGSTHNVQMVVNGNNVTWTFNNIQLPDSNTNEPESHGAISYKISFAYPVDEGTEITNTASIFFDFNDAIVTNTTLNTIFFPVGLNDILKENGARIFPNPTKNFVNIEVEEVSEIKIYDTQSRLINSFVISNHLKSVDMSDWASGIYLVKVVNKKNSSAFTLLKQ